MCLLGSLCVEMLADRFTKRHDPSTLRLVNKVWILLILLLEPNEPLIQQRSRDEHLFSSYNHPQDKINIYKYNGRNEPL